MAEAPPLQQIYYNPVGTCNLHCKHCWVDPDVDRPDHDPFAQRDRRDDEITPEQFFGILEDAKKLGLRHVKFTGGEPFLRRDTIDVMEGTAERKLGLTVETNATLLDDDTIARLAKIEPNQVAVSIDSADRAYHDRFRGVEGAHARALDAVRKLVAAGCNLQIIAAITLENLEAARDMIALGRRLGVGSVKLCPVASIGRGAAIHERGGTLSAWEFLNLYRRYGNPPGPPRPPKEGAVTCPRPEAAGARAGNCLEPEAPGAPGMKVHVEVPAAFRPIRRLKAMSLCRIKNLLGLLPNGDVSYCGIGMSHPELVMGSLLRDDIGSLWREHPRLLDIREGLPNGLEGVCSRCTMRVACLGVCRVHAHVRTGNLFAANWFCEEAEREGFFPQSRLVEAEAARCTGGAAGGC